MLGMTPQAVYYRLKTNGLIVQKDRSLLKWEPSGEFFNCDGYCPITGWWIGFNRHNK